MESDEFYARVLGAVVTAGLATTGMGTLVVCGDVSDRRVLHRLGFADVTISNLDERTGEKPLAPYRWSRQDAEQLDYRDGAFDLVLTYAGLHHCASPHRALTEMYRVAKVGVLVFESRDSLLIRLAQRLGLAPDYEVSAVVRKRGQAGGVRNTGIPNYIYRWTEREVRKTIQSYDPAWRPDVRFFYGLRLPCERLRMHTGRLGLRLAIVSQPLVRALVGLVPRLGNQLAFLVLKPGGPDRLRPWLRMDGGRIALDHEWTRRYFKTPGD